MKKSALIIIDMINDFIKGPLKLTNVNKIISNIKKLISWAHKSNIPVIYLNDAHSENHIEFKLWKKHAIINSYGAQIINELKPNKKDIIIEKNNYNGFINTILDSYLKDNNINNLYVCGVYTDVCVRELVSTGFQLGYDLNILKDATGTKHKINHIKTLKILNKFYNAKCIKTNDLIKNLSDE